MPEDDDERASLLSVWEDAFRDGYESKAAFRRGPCTEAAALCRNFVHAGRYSARRAPVAQWIEQRFPKPHSQPLPASGSNPENPSLPWSSESPLAHASCDPDRRTLVLALYEAGSKSEGSRKCSIHEHAGEFAIRSREKSASVRRFCRALFRTRTGDPLLTMERLRQPLAAGGNGFGLFSPFSRARDLRVIATDCNHGAP